MVNTLLILSGLAEQVDNVLPQTQCKRCGYPDCAHYAQAVALHQSDIDQCPPGGAEGVRRIAAVLNQAPKKLNKEHGVEGPRMLAVIDENWCIGCTLCLDACPTDAILGASKRMHTIVADHCTGCELCLPVCPVDCIALVNAGDAAATGWDNWSPALASAARSRYENHLKRSAEPKKHTEALENKELSALDSESLIEHDIAKKMAIGIALKKARLRNG